MMRVVLWSLTILRLVLIPVFVYAGATAQEVARSGADPFFWRWSAFAVLFVMGLTDALDGWMARRFELMTQIGATADAVADKLAQVALVVFLAVSVGPVFTPLPFWFLVVVFGRDLVLLVGVLVLRLRYGPLSVVHRAHGRVASFSLSAVLAWCVFGFPARGLTPLLLLTALASVASATIYAFDGAAQGRAIADLQRVRRG